jgi:hypothetical protein
MTILQGTAGNDDLRLAANDTSVVGGGGVDTIDLQDSPVAVNVDLNAGTLTAPGWLAGTVSVSGVTNIYGGWNGGTLTGGANTSYIEAPGGDTTVNGGASGANIVLGFGSDTVHGGAGNDEIFVGGNATSNNSNVIDGGGGYNGVSYVGAYGALFVDLYAGVNGVGGGAWHNGIYDHLINIVNIQGNNNGDTIQGDWQNNIIIGGTGNDFINSREGNDTLTGGGGHDSFVMVSHAGNDVITDFSTADDVIDVSAFFTNFAGVQAATTQQGANAVIALGSGSLTLDNVSSASLQASDFSFTALTPPTGGGATPAPTTVTGTAANNYAVSFQGVVRQYTVGTGGSTVLGGPEGANDALVNMHRIQFVDGYLAVSPTDTAGQVYRLYEAALGRAPDPVGLAGWTHALNGGVTLQSVANGFVTSQEFQQVYGQLSDSDFVTLLYHNVLHRAPDPGGSAGWTGALAQGVSRAQVLVGFSDSPENINVLAAPVQQGLWIQDTAAAEVARLYDTTLGRLPDQGGLAGWTHALENGSATLLQVTQGFVGSAEFQATYGSLNNADFVTRLYENSLHRGPDQAGLQSWVNALNGGVSRAQVVLGFSDSAEHIADTAPHIDNGIWLA